MAYGILERARVRVTRMPRPLKVLFVVTGLAWVVFLVLALVTATSGHVPDGVTFRGSHVGRTAGLYLALVYITVWFVLMAIRDRRAWFVMVALLILDVILPPWGEWTFRNLAFLVIVCLPASRAYYWSG